MACVELEPGRPVDDARSEAVAVETESGERELPGYEDEGSILVDRGGAGDGGIS